MARERVGRPGRAQPGGIVTPIPCSAVRNHLVDVLLHLRVRHPEWREYLVDDEAAEGDARDALHDDRKKRVPAAVIGELCSRHVIECALSPNHSKDIRLVLLVRIAPPGKVEQVRQLPQARGVIQKHSNCEGMTEVGHLRHIFAHVVVQAQLPVSLQQEYGQRRELLRSRGDVDGCRRPERNPVCDISHPVALRVENLPRFHDRNSATRRIRPRIARKD